mgnify:CR=1 FL=1
MKKIAFLLAGLATLAGPAQAQWYGGLGFGVTRSQVDASRIDADLTGNLGFHTAHHHRPGMHWSKLPTLHAEILPKIPKEAFTMPGYPWRWFGKCEGAENFAPAPTTPPTEVPQQVEAKG